MNDDELWRRVCAAQAEVRGSRIAFLHQAQDRAGILARALADRETRLDAIELLREIPNEEMRRSVFEPLVEIIAGAEKFFEWAQKIVLEMERAWVIEHVDAVVAPRLADDWFGYSAVCWLYGQLEDEALFARHRERCAAHADPGIRELAED